MGAKRRKKRGIKPKAVLSKIMERTAPNRVIFRADAKKEKSRNPHGYWIFRWRSGWDSNPRAREDYLISSQARYDHFDTAPYMLAHRFSTLFRQKTLERTDGKNSRQFRFNRDSPPQRFKSTPLCPDALPGNRFRRPQKRGNLEDEAAVRVFPIVMNL